MGNDLIHNREDLKPERDVSKSTKTEVERAKHALTERMLFGTQAQVRPQSEGCARIILALDCTSSMHEFVEARQITAEAASSIANGLFAKAATHGVRLQVQLAFFRGDDKSSKQPRQFQVSKKWFDTAAELAQAIVAIEHWPGWTQHCRLLRHAVSEAEQQAIQELVIVSDAFEGRTSLRPDGDDLKAACVHAQRLRDLGVKIVAGYKGTIEGGCPLNRAGVSAEQAFSVIAEANGGYAFLLRSDDLTARFSEIGTQAALVVKGDEVGAQVLLEHLRSIPFEMNVVGEQVPSSKCADVQLSEPEKGER